jgi:hypothetical protein
MLTATLITLVFMPTVYTLFEESWSALLRGMRHHEPAGDKQGPNRL